MSNVLFHALTAILSPTLDPPLSLRHAPVHMPRADALALVRILDEFAERPHILPEAGWVHLLISMWYICEEDHAPLDDPSIRAALLKALCVSQELTVVCRYKGNDALANTVAQLACLFAKYFHGRSLDNVTDNDKIVFQSTFSKLCKQYMSPWNKENILHVNCEWHRFSVLDLEYVRMNPDPVIFRLLMDYGANPFHRDVAARTPLQELREQFEFEVTAAIDAEVYQSQRDEVVECATILTGSGEELDEVVRIVRTLGRLDVTVDSTSSDSDFDTGQESI